MHLDYGLKKTGGYEMHLYKDDADVWRAHAMKDSESVYDLTDYIFTVSGPVSDSQTIQNRNEFKKIRGIAGQVTGAGAGKEVSIIGGTINTIVLTDEDGWYGLEFKHKGKAAVRALSKERDLNFYYEKRNILFTRASVKSLFLSHACSYSV
jgi:hypothetical protein